MKKNIKKLETKLIHSGEADPLVMGAVSMPVFQSSTFAYSGEQSYHDLKYIRLNNTPNHTALHEKLAAIENAESGLVTSSGMSAISTVFLTFLSAGDHLLVQDCLYGGTHDLITKDLPKLGISFDFISSEKETWESKLKPETKMIYCESITNPLMQVIDLESMALFAKKHGLISSVDNTFPSPVNFRPLEWDFDLSIHSCSKYLNGHSDIVAGAVMGNSELIEKVTHKLNHMGGSLDPHACFLLHRGLKTLSVRVKYQNDSAFAIAQFLQKHDAIEKINYPGLKTHPQHDLSSKFFDGFGGMLSFEIKGGVEEADRFIENVTLPVSAPSLGGVEALITRPAITSHAGMSQGDREELGISDRLIRLSVGIEATEDLIDDFEQALESV